MLRRSAGLGALLVGCAASGGPPVGPSPTDVVLEEPLAPSELPALGVTETMTGDVAGGERALRSVTANVATCLKPVVEREPALRGTMSFRVDLGPTVSATPAGGTLAGLSAGTCVRDALRGAAMAPGGVGAVDYTLTFGGSYAAQPLPKGSRLAEQWAGLDWNTPNGEVPAAAQQASASLREPFRRCAFGADPALSEGLWLVLRVAKGGAVTLGPSSAGDASECIQRTLRGAAFPDAGHDYALSVALRPVFELASAVGAAESDEQEFGMLGLLNTGSGSGDPSARGIQWGDEIGDAFGAGGLGLTGVGGRGEGIGLGSIGTIGHGAGTGTGQGFGNGSGRLGGAHRSVPPKLRMGATSVAGRLPPEVIQRIVRQNFGRFRLCYEVGLEKDPKLAGKVTVTFEIDRKGTAGKVSSTSDVSDKAVVACVQKAFVGLRFPEPEGGVVKVTYPIAFSPGDDAPAAPATPPAQRTVGGKPIASVAFSDIEKRLVEKGYAVARVPGFPTGDAPALFAHQQGAGVYSVTLGPRQDGARGPLCVAGTDARTLYVRGDRCQKVMSALLD